MVSIIITSIVCVTILVAIFTTRYFDYKESIKERDSRKGY